MAETEDTKESEYIDNLTVVIQQLQARFERLPTDKEVYRFVWGNEGTRRWIWTHKGLPENQR